MYGEAERELFSFAGARRRKEIERCNSIVMKAHSNALAQLGSFSSIWSPAEPNTWLILGEGKWVGAERKDEPLASSTFVFISFRLMENNVITKFVRKMDHMTLKFA